MTEVVLMQSRRFNNIWSLRDAHSDDIVAGPFIDRMCRNGAFAADSAVGAAITGGHDIVALCVQDDNGIGDTNLDAAEGALYRAAHGAFDSEVVR